MSPSDQAVYQILLERGLVQKALLDAVVAETGPAGSRLEATLLKKGLITAQDLVLILKERDVRLGGAASSASRFPGLASSDGRRSQDRGPGGSPQPPAAGRPSPPPPPPRAFPPPVTPEQASDAGFGERGVPDSDVAYARIAVKLAVISKEQARDVLSRIALAPPGAAGDLVSYLVRMGAIDGAGEAKIRQAGQIIGSCRQCRNLLYVRGPKAQAACPRCGAPAPPPLAEASPAAPGRAGGSSRLQGSWEQKSAGSRVSPPPGTGSRAPVGPPAGLRSHGGPGPAPAAGPAGVGAGSASRGLPPGALASSGRRGGGSGSASPAPPGAGLAATARFGPGAAEAVARASAAGAAGRSAAMGTGLSSSPIPPPLAPGAVSGGEALGLGGAIDGYTILGTIGDGPRGRVYRAETQDGRAVALKIFPADVASAGEILTVHERADELATVEHRSLARVLEAGEVPGGGLYIATELVSGTSLADPEQRNAMKLRVRRALEVMADAARAVHAAHEQGILHRDLKPSNIRIDEGGSPKVIDFDLLPSRSDPSVQAPPEIRTRHFLYKAPEQLAAKPHATKATDVWSLGVILYEMLAGAPPFEGATPDEVAEAVRKKTPPPVIQKNQGLHADVDLILRVALDQRPRFRYATPAAFADDIERYLAGKPVAARPPTALAVLQATAGSRGGLLLLGGVGALLLLFLIGFGAVKWWKARRADALHKEVETERQAAEEAFAAGRLEDALHQAEAAIAASVLLEESPPPWALEFRGRSALAGGDLAAAEPDLDAAVAGDSARLSAREARVTLYLAARRWADAQRDIAEILRTAGREDEARLVWAHTRLGICQREQGDEASAKSSFLRAIETADRIGAPAPIDALVGAAEIHHRAHEDHYALNLCTRAVQLDRTALRAFLLRAEIEMAGEEWANARRDLTAAVRLDATLVDARIDIAACYRNEGNPREAQRWLDEALTLSAATDPAVRCRIQVERGFLLLGSGGDVEARDAFTEAINLDPENARAYYGRAMAERNQGFRDDAIQDATAAIARRQDYGEAWELRGTIRYLQQQYQDAQDDFTRAEENGRRTFEVYFGRGMSRFSLHQYAPAMEDLSQAVQLRQDLVEPYFRMAQMGLLEGATRDPVRALENAQRAAALAPQEPLCFKILAEAQAQNGNFQEAIRIVQDALSRFSNLRGTPLGREMQARLEVYQQAAGGH